MLVVVRLLSLRLHLLPVRGCYPDAVDAGGGEVVEHEAVGVRLQGEVPHQAAVSQDHQLVA